jgi:hypothetical protein
MHMYVYHMYVKLHVCIYIHVFMSCVHVHVLCNSYRGVNLENLILHSTNSTKNTHYFFVVLYDVSLHCRCLCLPLHSWWIGCSTNCSVVTIVVASSPWCTRFFFLSTKRSLRMSVVKPQYSHTWTFWECNRTWEHKAAAEPTSTWHLLQINLPGGEFPKLLASRAFIFMRFSERSVRIPCSIMLTIEDRCIKYTFVYSYLILLSEQGYQPPNKK